MNGGSFANRKSKNQNLKITVTDVRPGFVATDMAKGEKLFWAASPKKAAIQIYRAIRRKRKMVYVTKRWRLFALLMRIAPRWMYDLF